MKVRILLFAHLKELAGSDEIEIELVENAKGKDLIEKLAETYPLIAPQKYALKLSVDGEYIGNDDALTENSEIAVITPVSGG